MTKQSNKHFIAEWKDDTRPYSAGGKNLYLGKWCVISIGWDGVNKTDERWVIYTHLPGLKSRLDKQYKNIEDAKIKAEQVVDMWIKKSTIK